MLFIRRTKFLSLIQTLTVLWYLTGEYLYDVGTEGSGDGQLRVPFGLAIDKFNRLIVCDWRNRRMQLFTLDGKYVAKMAGSFFDRNGQIFGCAVSDTGRLFVTDKKKHCIYVFN